MSIKDFKGINDPVNIMGISALVTDYEDVQSNIDLSQIENEVVNRMKKTKKQKSAPEIFRQELDQVLQGMDGVKLYDDHEVGDVATEVAQRVTRKASRPVITDNKKKLSFAPPSDVSSMISSDPESDGDPVNGPAQAYNGWMSSKNSPYVQPRTRSSHSQPHSQPHSQQQDSQSQYSYGARGAYPYPYLQSHQQSHQQQQYESSSGQKSGFTQSNWYQKQTQEEKAQDVIHSVLAGMNRSGTQNTSSGGYNQQPQQSNTQDRELEDLIAKEQEKDLKSMLIAQYDLLYTTLKEEGVDLERIPKVNEGSPLNVINAALKMLRYKNDLRRYVSIGEDVILFIAYGLESAFNGKTSYYGYYPTLTGWPDAIKPRIKRMRADTSAVVSAVMNNFNFGHFTRMMLELVPSAFLYSRTKRSQVKGEVTETEWRDNIHHLDSINAAV